jgi:radical SAM superfamily enzyme YgiQ (UPF0313 family)
MTGETCKVLMVYPRFNPNSFWNFRSACELTGLKRQAPPLGLITVAALLPGDWQVRLIDRNIEELDDASIAWADMVMTGGMLAQQVDTLHLVRRCQAHGKPVVVGGPDATSSPHIYAAADFRVLGEAEDIIPDFVAAWRRGERSGTFEAEKFKVDVTSSPVPRFDLLRLRDYYHVGVQFSRGCPFKCEFCDIIELFGRVPRVKEARQLLGELDALRALGHRGFVDFVDDNLIGNKKALKLFLPQLIAWQKAHGYPFQFSTEASLNLADDTDLLDMLRQAQFVVIFVGIESPDPDVLVATQKKQNTRRDIAQSVQRIYEAGIFVIAGFIVGLDEEPKSIAQPIIDLIEEAPIAICMVGLLYALPNTQLTRRLEREGRLHPGHDVEQDAPDQCVAGLNFDPSRPRVDVLSDYLSIIETIYAPKAYFDRVVRIARSLRMHGRNVRGTPANLMLDLRNLVKFVWNLHLRQPRLIPHFWKTVARCLPGNPRSAMAALTMVGMYSHLGPFAQYVAGEIRAQRDDVRDGRWQAPVRPPQEIRAAS